MPEDRLIAKFMRAVWQGSRLCRELISKLRRGRGNPADLAHPEDSPETAHAFRTTREAGVVALHAEHGHFAARLER